MSGQLGEGESGHRPCLAPSANWRQVAQASLGKTHRRRLRERGEPCGHREAKATGHRFPAPADPVHFAVNPQRTPAPSGNRLKNWANPGVVAAVAARDRGGVGAGDGSTGGESAAAGVFQQLLQPLLQQSLQSRMQHRCCPSTPKLLGHPVPDQPVPLAATTALTPASPQPPGLGGTASFWRALRGACWVMRTGCPPCPGSPSCRYASSPLGANCAGDQGGKAGPKRVLGPAGPAWCEALTCATPGW